MENSQVEENKNPSQDAGELLESTQTTLSLPGLPSSDTAKLPARASRNRPENWLRETVYRRVIIDTRLTTPAKLLWFYFRNWMNQESLVSGADAVQRVIADRLSWKEDSMPARIAELVLQAYLKSSRADYGNGLVYTVCNGLGTPVEKRLIKNPQGKLMFKPHTAEFPLCVTPQSGGDHPPGQAAATPQSGGDANIVREEVSGKRKSESPLLQSWQILKDIERFQSLRKETHFPVTSECSYQIRAKSKVAEIKAQVAIYDDKIARLKNELAEALKREAA